MTLKSASAIMLIVVFASCKDNASELNITNGVAAGTEEFPAVTQVSSAGNSPRELNSCSATWVSPNVLLTAAHCLVSDNGTNKQSAWVTISGQRHNSNAIHIHNRYRRGSSSMDGSFDIALVSFAQDLATHFVNIGNEDIPQGAKVTLVGFGYAEPGNAASGGTKRFGTNTVAASRGRAVNGVRMAADLIKLSPGVLSAQDAKAKGVASGENAANLQGDSGGPLFYRGRLVGVASTVDTNTPGQLSGNYIEPYVHREWLAAAGVLVCGITRNCPKAANTDAAIRSPGGASQGEGQTTVPDTLGLKIAVYSADTDNHPRVSVGAPRQSKKAYLCQGAEKECRENEVLLFQFQEASNVGAQKVFFNSKTTAANTVEKDRDYTLVVEDGEGKRTYRSFRIILNSEQALFLTTP